MPGNALFLEYPKCSTCQKAKKWLDEHGVAYDVRHIVEDNPTADELQAWHGRSGLPLKRFFNTSGMLYREMGLSKKLPAMSEADQYELLAREMLKRHKQGRPITFYHYMLDLTGGPCVYKRVSGCGSGTEYMAVTPWGDLYPCHQFVGEEAYKLGDVWSGVTNTALREEFRACNAYARPACADCWARLYCSGGCAANAYHASGSIQGVYEAGCELFRKRMECAIMLQAALAEEA